MSPLPVANFEQFLMTQAKAYSVMLSLKITTETSTCAQDGVTWFEFTFLPEQLKHPTKYVKQ